VVAAGAEDDESARDRLRQDLHAQWNPEPVPFQWPGIAGVTSDGGYGG
jgi:hypothetical protein